MSGLTHLNAASLAEHLTVLTPAGASELTNLEKFKLPLPEIGLLAQLQQLKC